MSFLFIKSLLSLYLQIRSIKLKLKSNLYKNKKIGNDTLQTKIGDSLPWL